jgi:hypothetical protein
VPDEHEAAELVRRQQAAQVAHEVGQVPAVPGGPARAVARAVVQDNLGVRERRERVHDHAPARAGGRAARLEDDQVLAAAEGEGLQLPPVGEGHERRVVEDHRGLFGHGEMQKSPPKTRGVLDGARNGAGPRDG